MPFKIKKRGKLTYYYEADEPVFINRVIEWTAPYHLAH